MESNSKGLHQSSGKEKESCCLLFPPSTKREIRQSHVVVVQRRQRNVQKGVMHVQSCCFACLNLLIFCRSRWRRRRRCVNSLLTTLTIVVTTKPFSQHKQSVPQTFLVLTQLKTNLLHGLKPLLLLLLVTLKCLMSRKLFTNIPTSSTPQNVVEMFFEIIR